MASLYRLYEEEASTITDYKTFTEPISYEDGNPALKPEKPATWQNKAHSGQVVHSHRLDREKEERARLREMYSTYQENIRRAGSSSKIGYVTIAKNGYVTIAKKGYATVAKILWTQIDPHGHKLSDNSKQEETLEIH